MGFVVLHMEKALVPTAERPPTSSVLSHRRTPIQLARILTENSSTIPMGERRTAAIQHRLENAGLTRKIGNNQVQAIRIIVSGTHEGHGAYRKRGRLDEWCADNASYFAFMFSKENSVCAPSSGRGNATHTHHPCSNR